MITKQT